MNESIVREIAQQIAKEQTYENWGTVILIILLTGVASYIGAYLGGYAKKRGESFATKADFKDLLAQLKITTQATEEVKLKVGHEDWATREYKTLKRLKLEELMQAIHETEEWLSEHQNHIIFAGPASSKSSPITKVERLSGLYFPELDPYVKTYNQNCRTQIMDILKTQQQLLALGPNTPNANQTLQNYVSSWGKKYAGRLNEISVIENKAKDIMDDLISP